MDSIDIFNDSAKIIDDTTPRKIISWITILFILMFLTFIIFLIPFNIYKNYFGIVVVDEEASYVYINYAEYAEYAEYTESDFPFDKSNYLYIDGVKYKYDVNIDMDNIILKVELDDGININNNLVNISLLKCRTTVFDIIRAKIKKGFGL